MKYSTPNQHFLRELHNVKLTDIEIQYLEDRGILTLEELANFEHEFVLKRNPMEISERRMKHIIQEANDLLKIFEHPDIES